jgi:thiosulfate dehydrogenase
MRTVLIACLALAAGAIAQQSVETIVTLCDNKTEIVIPNLKPGEKLDRERAFQVADTFMQQWKKENPGSNWIMAQNLAPRPDMALQVRTAAKAEPKQAGVYSAFSPREEFIWKTELDKFVKEGDRIFHNADAFGGTIGVSCDMCHPNAANTHPETYPKYQVQMQKVALLRDMINWCIQHPAKGKPLADDDPRLRAMEAYIMFQRKGKVMEPGKH